MPVPRHLVLHCISVGFKMAVTELFGVPTVHVIESMGSGIIDMGAKLIGTSDLKITLKCSHWDSL